METWPFLFCVMPLGTSFVIELMTSKKLIALKKRFKEGILNDNDVRRIVGQMDDILTPDMRMFMNKFDVDLEFTVRVSTLASRCKNEREMLGWSVKQAAEKVGVPQYRIRAIESGSQRGFSQKEVRIYVNVLGLNDWFSRWHRANRMMFKTIPANPDRVSPWARKVRGANV